MIFNQTFWIYIPWNIKTQQTKRMKANFYLNANKFVTKFWNLPFFQWSSHNQNKKDYLQLKENHKFGRREVGVYNRWDYWSKKFGTNLSPALDVGINLGALQIRTFFQQIWALSKWICFFQVPQEQTYWCV